VEADGELGSLYSLTNEIRRRAMSFKSTILRFAIQDERITGIAKTDKHLKKDIMNRFLPTVSDTGISPGQFQAFHGE